MERVQIVHKIVKSRTKGQHISRIRKLVQIVEHIIIKLRGIVQFGTQ